MEMVVADIFKDLTDVGTKKAMGYLPLNTIVEYGGDIKKLIEWATSFHYNYVVLNENECDVRSGALYIWDDKMLTRILEKYETILLKANILITPSYEYVNYIIRRTVSYDNFPLAYIVIGLTFNDSRFAGKGDNLEEISKEFDKIYYRLKKEWGESQAKKRK
jgi:hypothetical protein